MSAVQSAFGYRDPTAPLADWDTYLRGRFPGYLLPDSAVTALTVEEAQRFLEALTGRADTLETLRAVSMLARHGAALAAFVRGPLADVARNLPSRTERVRREWEGGFQGRLAVAETAAQHLRGRRTTFITQTPRRSFDLPENVLLRAVADRLLETLTRLRERGGLPDTGWALSLRDSEGILRRLLASTALRQVNARTATPYDAQAARAARHPAYREAAHWADVLRESLDDTDPARIARVVAEGALLPLAASTRFELAVAIRLAEALHAALELHAPGAFRLVRALIARNRAELFAFEHASGVALRVYYNQAKLEEGPVDNAGRHYLGNTGRMRPDVTVTLERNHAVIGAVVIECKDSSDPGYLLTGLKEAMLYRWEYDRWLMAWPKAMLVASGRVNGVMRIGDDVIACGWDGWPGGAVVEALARTVVDAERARRS